MEWGSCAETWLRAPLVWEIVGGDVDVVRFGIFFELNGLNRPPAFDEGFAHPVHSIHYAAVLGKDDGVIQIGLVDELGVKCDSSARWAVAFSIEPKRLIQLANIGQLYFETRKSFGQLDQTIDIPDQHTSLSRTEVVLLSHVRWLLSRDLGDCCDCVVCSIVSKLLEESTLSDSVPYVIRGSGPPSQQPIGVNTAQLLTHLQQQMHFSLSTVGAANPSWDMAPTGQAGSVGQA